MRLTWLLSILTACVSWTTKLYIPSLKPGADLRVIDRAQCRSISRSWYEKALEAINESSKSDKDALDEHNAHEITRALRQAIDVKNKVDTDRTIQNVNKMESVTQSLQNPLVCMAWMPLEESTNATETLALVVCEMGGGAKNLRCVVCNPLYDWSEHIPLRELRKAMLAVAVNVTYFEMQPENKRVVLEWWW
tara:strand:+ start:15699 stop:16274 length:576 start_codon:yes stop_codon:yes gene_type:complete